MIKTKIINLMIIIYKQISKQLLRQNKIIKKNN